MNAAWDKLAALQRRNLKSALKPAQASERLTGVPACITLAQFIIEAAWGKSDCGGARNYFGIKADSRWSGPRVNRTTKEYRGGAYVTEDHWFRAYPTMSDSFVDHGRFLRDNPRYADLFSLSSSNYVGWANGLLYHGYATDPQYARLLISMIETYGLMYYNLPPAAGSPQA